jgi:CBS domain-containing protein
MLPAFPMDGGRALRALLATRMDERRATRIAARLGQGMSVVFALVGWLSNPFLVLIALFVWVGAAHEARVADLRAALAGVAVERVMVTKFATLTPDDRLATAVDHLQRGTQHDFPVLADGDLAGVLTRDRVLGGLAARGPDARVADTMERDLLVVAPQDGLDTVLGRLEARESPVALVVQDHRLVGMLTADAVAEFLRIRAALDRPPA